MTKPNKKPNLLLILDGYGLTNKTEGNAIFGNSQYIDSLIKDYPFTTLEASGFSVGLPDGQMGNSEVGHLNIGAGRIVYQDLSKISKSIIDGDFFNNSVLVGACKTAKTNNSKLHLMGLVSDGGVHSHISHIYALLLLAKQQGLKQVYVHCFLDGRDTSPQSGVGFLADLQTQMQALQIGKIADVCGRYYAMDRDKRWERLEKAYNLLTKGEGKKADCPVSAVKESYEEGTTDEFVLPISIDKNGVVEDGDSIIFFNYRPDRAREITSAFTQEDFCGFDLQGRRLRNLKWVCMTNYDEKFKDVEIAFLPQSLKNTFGEYISSLGLKQLRIAETEKYAHVTFFFNGGIEKPNANEERILIDSPKIATYDLQPSMSAREVTAKFLQSLKNDYDVIVLNFANCDMVGHTGVFEAAKQAVAVVDECVKTVVETVLNIGGRVFLTSDHGNAEQMLDEDKNPFTTHTNNKVPFVIVDKDLKKKELFQDGKLCDIVPTMLQLMKIQKPTEMTGKSLLKN